MSTSDLRKLPKGISVERLIEACDKWGVDIHETIAKALRPEILQDPNSGMNVYKQTGFALQIWDKATPSQQAIKHSGDQDEPIVIHYSSDDEKL